MSTTKDELLARLRDLPPDDLKDIEDALREGARKLVEHKLDIAKTLHTTRGNPLYAWQAYQFARLTRSPVPDWVLEYFDQSAEALLDKTNSGGAAAISESLGFKKPGKSGAGTAHSQFWRDGEHPKWATFAADVLGYLKGGGQETNAFYIVAKKYGVSEATIRRAWEFAKETFPEDCQVS